MKSRKGTNATNRKSFHNLASWEDIRQAVKFIREIRGRFPRFSDMTVEERLGDDLLARVAIRLQGMDG